MLNFLYELNFSSLKRNIKLELLELFVIRIKILIFDFLQFVWTILFILMFLYIDDYILIALSWVKVNWIFFISKINYFFDLIHIWKYDLILQIKYNFDITRSQIKVNFYDMFFKVKLKVNSFLKNFKSV